MALPIIQDPSQNLMLVQQKWKSQLDPLLASPSLNGRALNNIQLSVGSNTIPHGLGAAQQGWYLTDQNAASQIFRSSPFNAQNLVLTSSAQVTVNLWVF